MSIHEYGQKLSFTQGYLQKNVSSQDRQKWPSDFIQTQNWTSIEQCQYLIITLQRIAIWLQNTILSNSPVTEAFICGEYTLKRSTNLI